MGEFRGDQLALSDMVSTIMLVVGVDADVGGDLHRVAGDGFGVQALGIVGISARAADSA
jgi:hypothetical protein